MKKTIETKVGRLLVKDPCQDEKCAIVIDNCETGTWQACYVPGYNGRPELMILAHEYKSPAKLLEKLYTRKLEFMGHAPIDSGTVAVYEPEPIKFPTHFPAAEYLGANWYALETLDGDGSAGVNVDRGKSGTVLGIVVTMP